jgi:hypothetical protein
VHLFYGNALTLQLTQLPKPPFMKLYWFVTASVVGILFIAWLPKNSIHAHSATDKKDAKPLTTKDVANASLKKWRTKATEAWQFVNEKNYNTENCFFIEMSKPSGSQRFYIYNFRKDTIVNAGLVAHGNCFEYWLEGRRYSNVVGSGCTSLGKYKIGAAYVGKWGYSYKLHGLEKTNNKAFERTVVLHSHSCVPTTETGEEICQSNGCPTVAPKFLLALKTIINNSKKPVLLWIYE